MTGLVLKKGNKKTTKLKEQDIQAAAQLFLIFWAALVLNPRGHQSMRATFKQLGLVKPRGPLDLTTSGKRLIAYIQGRAEKL